jgi:hypothetical protein
MKYIKKYNEKLKGDQFINIDGLKSISDKFSKINQMIESGKEIPSELSKNFITVDLSNNPHDSIQ